mgnify:CR=1 FL=1
MTNEELVRRYYGGGGDERTLEELYRRNLGLIRRIARETAREFNCLHMDRERPGELSGYTKTILEDLCGEGALEFLTRVQSREYEGSRAVLATYLYPHLKGRMTRWLEQHIGNLSLSKHEMDAVRQAQRLYHSRRKWMSFWNRLSSPSVTTPILLVSMILSLGAMTVIPLSG